MARIRSIKPEFWQSVDLAKLSEHARLMAIALLNHSDDEGYFFANVALVRAACFPFDDDSTTCRRSIDELSSVGYIEVRIPSPGKEIGRVVKFLQHQRIDRPKPSNLADLFESSKDRRSVDDTSLLEQGTGNREQGAGTGNREVEQDCAANAADTIDPGLLDFCDWWNSLQDAGLVRSRVTTKPPAETLRKRWKTAQRDHTIRNAIARRDDIKARLKQSSFAKQSGWLTAAKLLGGKNQDHEVIVVKLLEGGYEDREPTGDARTIANLSAVEEFANG